MRNGRCHTWRANNAQGSPFRPLRLDGSFHLTSAKRAGLQGPRRRKNLKFSDSSDYMYGRTVRVRVQCIPGLLLHRRMSPAALATDPCATGRTPAVHSAGGRRPCRAGCWFSIPLAIPPRWRIVDKPPGPGKGPRTHRLTAAVNQQARLEYGFLHLQLRV